ncbi:WecB/TagA/CpsF family glycosyltransferase [Candidatus Roizmanbacteria bacterium]|nr:WecB/TagA/CpsF family glycosyltransferase [Candidatus Roizmanbacteria bacterium]
MNNSHLLGIPVESETIDTILEKIKKNIETPQEFFHIVSLNPEILVAIQSDPEFKRVIAEGQIKIPDGIGVVVAARLLHAPLGMRITGVDLMEKLVGWATRYRVRVMLIGGKPNLAEKIADCYRRAHPKLEIMGINGVSNIRNVDKDEEEEIFSIVRAFMPQIVFVSYGSPAQEKWIYRNRAQFKGLVCMGVGGAFDFIGGGVPRAPRWVRSAGFEWLYRLIREPWRWRRQLKLFEFIGLVGREALSAVSSSRT